MRAAAKVAGCSQGSVNLEKKEMLRDEAQSKQESEKVKEQADSQNIPVSTETVVTW